MQRERERERERERLSRALNELCFTNKVPSVREM